MAAGPNWGALPSVIIVEILSYLSRKDRLKTSSVCKRWRSCLYHPILWSKISYRLSAQYRQQAKFLADTCGRFVRETTVEFNSHSAIEVRECCRILSILATNKNTQSLSLKPSSCHIDWPTSAGSDLLDRFLDNIEAVLKNSRKLKHFSLGCVEELLEHSSDFVQILSDYHANHLESLHLASVKEDSESYGIIELQLDQFVLFSSLHTLSIDYDHLTNGLLELFADNRKTKLRNLTLHVHGVDPEHEKITNETWRKLCNYCPKLEVTINLIHSSEGVSRLLDILQVHMPLVHFRQFFCTHINMAAINFMATHFGNTLQSVHIIDGLVDNQPSLYLSTTDEDPFVMLAWRCPRLQYFALIGYELADDDLIAMARLRGKELHSLLVPLSCVSVVEEEEENVWVSLGAVGQEFSDKVSESLGRSWHPLSDEELPPAVKHFHADAESAYMKTLLDDQSWKR